MDTRDINKLLQGQTGFLGTFPRDQLPTVIKRRPSGLIVNTDTASEPGEHWVAIYLANDSCGEYFDSFGLPPLHKEIIAFLNDHNDNGWVYNTITLQDVSSDTCGIYTAFYLQSRLSGYSNEQFLSLFTKHGKINDFIAPYLYLLSRTPASGR